jgi:hypothetical protein
MQVGAPHETTRRRRGGIITVVNTSILVQITVKFSLQQALKAHRGSRDIALLFL